MISKSTVVQWYEKINSLAMHTDNPEAFLEKDIYEFEKTFFKNEERQAIMIDMYGALVRRVFRSIGKSLEDEGKPVNRSVKEAMFQQAKKDGWEKAKSHIDYGQYTRYVFIEITGIKIIDAIKNGEIEKLKKEDTKMDKIVTDYSKAEEPIELTRENLKDLIDLALQTGDKQWFEELQSKMKAI